MPDALRITQGASRSIVIDNIVDSDGEPLVVTSWTVFAQARAHPRSEAILAEWATNPDDNQGVAVAVDTTVTIEIPHAMSSAWAWNTAVLHVEITDPDSGRRERVLDKTLVVDPEAAR